MRTISLSILFLFLLSACGMQHPAQTAYHNYRHPQTPPEFYSQAVPASFSPTGSNRAESSDSTFPETKSEKRHVAVIGVLAGLLVVAGAVVPIVLTR
jgi:hypothetical protein